MGKRFLVTTLIFSGVQIALSLALNLLTLILFIIFFTEAGEPNFVETHILPAVSSMTGILSWPGELLFEEFRIGGAFSTLNPLLKQAMFLLNGLLWGLLCSSVWTLLKNHRTNYT